MSMWNLDEHSNWRDVLRFAGTRGDRDWVYIITGRGGPTGKTFLCNQLKKNNYNAFEISEDISTLVNYRDDRNHYIVDHVKKQVVIVLNKLINRETLKHYRKREAVQEAYNLAVKFRDTNEIVSINDIIGYLGEALED